jgi:RsiW-degrading membrane proteinase PrsW (M82 family)
MQIVIELFIALTIFMVIYIRSKDRGSKEPTSMLYAAAGFGVLGIGIAVLLEMFFTSADTSTLAAEPLGVTSYAVYEGFAVGLIEEAAKFLPLAIFIYRKRYFNEHTDGILYFGLAGLGFGLPENILYTLDGGVGAGLGRLLLTPFFHAATTAIVGYFLARKKVRGGNMIPVVTAFVAMVGVHGYYDFGLMTGVPLFVLSSYIASFCLTGTFFWIIAHAQHVDQQLGISAVGSNAFCRACGAPNPKRNLYCQRCGSRA